MGVLRNLLSHNTLPTWPSPAPHARKDMVKELKLCLSIFPTTAGGRDTWPLNLNGFEGNEAQVRMVLDVILVRFCHKHNLKIVPEQALPEAAPFTGKADYVLYSDGRPVAIVEAKRCLGYKVCDEARHSVFIAAMAQSCAMLAGFQSEQPATPLFAIVTDARGWMVVSLTSKNRPVLQLWPHGRAILELTGPAELAHLLTCLGRLIRKRPRCRHDPGMCFTQLSQAMSCRLGARLCSISFMGLHSQYYCFGCRGP